MTNTPQTQAPPSDTGKAIVKVIPLTRGLFALVDADKYEALSKFKWTASVRQGRSYAQRSDGNKRIYMHRELMKFPDGMVDHINHNGLDNRISNLRVCNKNQNNHNSRMNQNNTTGYKGVSWSREKLKPYRAAIAVDGKSIHLGHFETSEQAARAYDDAARKYHGQFAKLNFE